MGSVNNAVVLLEAKKVERVWPANMPPDEAPLFHSEQCVSLKEVKLHHFRNKRVNSSGIVFSGLKVQKECLIWPNHISSYGIKYVVREYVKKKTRKAVKGKKYFLCFDYWSDGYFHWILEVLPRILVVEKQLMEKNAVLILPAKIKNQFHTDTLKIFSNLQIEWVAENEVLLCDELYLPDRLAPSGSNNPDYMKAVQEKVRKYYGFNPDPTKNIYVSRMKTPRRKIDNEAEVIELLKKYDFDVICFEDYSFEEQIKLMQNVKNCISIHGANLTNVMFMAEGGKALEFRMKKDAVNNYYYALAAACNIQYYYQGCDFTFISTQANNFNLSVDIPTLERNVLEMLK